MTLAEEYTAKKKEYQEIRNVVVEAIESLWDIYTHEKTKVSVGRLHKPRWAYYYVDDWKIGDVHMTLHVEAHMGYGEYDRKSYRFPVECLEMNEEQLTEVVLKILEDEGKRILKQQKAKERQDELKREKALQAEYQEFLELKKKYEG